MTPNLPNSIKLFLTIGLITVSCWLLVAHGLSYRLLGYRYYPRSLDERLVTVLVTRFEDTYGAQATSNDLREFVLSYTASSLHFAFKRNRLRDPNEILAGKAAHCTMYSVVLSALYNQMAQQLHWKSNCRVGIGQVYVFGVNLHQFVNKPFFATHDICVVRDANGVQAVDAVAFDVIGMTSARLRP